jgi:hypothetical protein
VSSGYLSRVSWQVGIFLHLGLSFLTYFANV